MGAFLLADLAMSMAANRTINTTCPYCGVGCGLLVDVDATGQVRLRGDPEHPANQGRLCAKGAALAETLDVEERLLYPEIRGERVPWDAALEAVAAGFQRVLTAHGPGAVAFYVSGQLLTEDYYVANKLMKGFLGSANIDTNSRLCMASSVAGHQRAFGSDTVPGSYEDLEQAELVVLVGSNLAWCHPVLFQRVMQARAGDAGRRLVVIDPRRTATAEAADLHLALRPGTDVALFNGLLVYLHEHAAVDRKFVATHTHGSVETLNAARASTSSIAAVADTCGLAVDDVARFYAWFSRTPRTVTAYSQGVNQSSSGTDKVNAIINCHLLTGRIGRPGMGPFSLTGQPNAMGGREVGGLANQLAAHMQLGDARQRRQMQRFWQAPQVAQAAGLKAVDLFRAVEQGQVKALWIMATNPVVSLPEADRVRAALRACEFVVVSDCMRHTDTTAYAEVLLPAMSWGEKDGTVTNSERRISRQRPFLKAAGEAQPDWWIVAQVAQRLGFTNAFAYHTAADIFREHAALSGFENDGARAFNISALAGISDAAYDALPPQQWPITGKAPGGTPRLFADGGFFTADRKARLVPLIPRPPVNAPDADYPWVLNTGRVRDHWHTLTRTGQSPRLSAHRSEPEVELHPDDAATLSIVDGTLVRVRGRGGALLARARLQPGQRTGEAFVPMHWNDQYAACSRVGAAVNAVVDPISGQPEFKHTPVRLEPYPAAWYGFILTRQALPRLGVDYWVRITETHCRRYELAHSHTPSDWPRWVREAFGAAANDQWLEYFDATQGCYRAVHVVNGRLQGCFYGAPTPRLLPARAWLAGLFAEPLSPMQRRQVLAGRPTAGVDPGRIVCACFGVGEHTIAAAIDAQRLHSVEAVGAVLKAGTNCGACIPELNGLLRQREVRPCAS